MKNNPLPRLDTLPKDDALRRQLLETSRFKPGMIWEDPKGIHRIACLDITDETSVQRLMNQEKAVCSIQDPPYNLVAFEERSVDAFCDWCRQWIEIQDKVLSEDSSLYIWLGADQKEGFQPLPDFMIMMRGLPQFSSRSWISLRNQRGYGTQQNWMAVRQELLYYTKGKPAFAVQFTDIPKILRGYYKEVGGEKKENLQRSKSPNIRPGNIWVDIQQVFYRMEENISGCYAQKPIKSIDRIIAASSQPGEIVVDFFGHSGTTLMAAEILNRRCFTADYDPIFCEIMLRRLEHYRKTGKVGFQNSHPFEDLPHILIPSK